VTRPVAACADASSQPPLEATPAASSPHAATSAARDGFWWDEPDLGYVTAVQIGLGYLHDRSVQREYAGLVVALVAYEDREITAYRIETVDGEQDTGAVVVKRADACCIAPTSEANVRGYAERRRELESRGPLGQLRIEGV
jgi:hypothetical protein